MIRKTFITVLSFILVFAQFPMINTEASEKTPSDSNAEDNSNYIIEKDSTANEQEPNLNETESELEQAPADTVNETDSNEESAENPNKEADNNNIKKDGESGPENESLTDSSSEENQNASIHKEETEKELPYHSINKTLTTEVEEGNGFTQVGNIIYYFNEHNEIIYSEVYSGAVIERIQEYYDTSIDNAESNIKNIYYLDANKNIKYSEESVKYFV